MITFVTCWYNLKAKFPSDNYRVWMSNLILNVNNFNLVIYTDAKSKVDIEPYINNNPLIKVVIKEMSDMYGYRYKKEWIQNHNNNTALKQWKVDWELNMLWSEKINFVKEAIETTFLGSDWYGWCDIGYFRGRPGLDLSIDAIKAWPKVDKEKEFNKDKIYYNMVGTNETIHMIHNSIKNSDYKGLPVPPIPMNQVSVSGGFFIIHKDKLQWWWDKYYNRLQLYFENNYLVKDDQMIVIDCMLREIKHFNLLRGQSGDIWFSFGPFLL